MENYFYRKLVFAKSKSSGTSNYADLSNKPQINGVTLDGNKTSSDLGIIGGATYTAGTNIEITEDNVINNTIPYNSTVPAGGTEGQILMKNSNADYDFSWTSLADYDEVSF